MKFFLILHGPNLNLLGKRKLDIYGNRTEDMILDEIRSKYDNSEFELFQSNHEGLLIDKIHDCSKYDAIILNPGAFGHYSYAIRDAIESIDIPVVEVHLSDIMNRENFRKNLILSDVCISTFKGYGIKSYFKAINLLLDLK